MEKYKIKVNGKKYEFNIYRFLQFKTINHLGYLETEYDIYPHAISIRGRLFFTPCTGSFVHELMHFIMTPHNYRPMDEDKEEISASARSFIIADELQTAAQAMLHPLNFNNWYALFVSDINLHSYEWAYSIKRGEERVREFLGKPGPNFRKMLRREISKLQREGVYGF